MPLSYPRLVQPVLDRFVAAEAPYEKEAMLYSRPLTFTGRKLVMNADTGASGFIQVGILRGDGRPQTGYGVEAGQWRSLGVIWTHVRPPGLYMSVATEYDPSGQGLTRANGKSLT